MTNLPLRSRFEGAVLGLALGDAFGAPYEGGPIERLVWAAIGKTSDGRRRWTDDTRMSLDLIECLVANGAVAQDDLAARFARSYRWRRGYGPGAAKLLRRVRRGGDWRRLSASVFPGGSFGNGGAMRAPVIGTFYWNDREGCARAAREATVVTHAHPLGVEGAQIVARATSAAVGGGSAADILDAAQSGVRSSAFDARIAIARRWIQTGAMPSSREVVAQLGNGIAAEQSCATAIYLAVRFLDDAFEELHAFVVRCGGDTDTIGAMAGALWGAARGADALPVDWLNRLEDASQLRAAAIALYDAST